MDINIHYTQNLTHTYIHIYFSTGSGKTFTLTGGPEKYADRGIIPRSISMLFGEFRKKTDTQFKMFISYMEIYNDKVWMDVCMYEYVCKYICVLCMYVGVL